MPKNAILALESGKTFEGLSFGCEGEAYGEVVFNTSITGYQEILTDPSYYGQIVCMTYPLIGNYGVNSIDVESEKPQVQGFIIKELSLLSSNFRQEKTLQEYFVENKVLGIQGIDTRELTIHLRRSGSKKGVISTIDLNRKSLIEKAKKSPGIVGIDLVQEVTCQKPYTWEEPVCDIGGPIVKSFEKKLTVVVLDCGTKRNILRLLVTRGCHTIVVPASTDYKQIQDKNPDGVLLSNGPGDPAAIPYVVETVKNLVGKVPIFGICLGHQILGLAFGGKTYKLKFGHRGANQPVMNLKTGKVEITSQNHGFAVDTQSIKDNDVELTHINLNDKTSEGLRHKSLPVFSVQYHPEASPGPQDSNYLFDEFIKLCLKKLI
ncbi:carbamoyl phosphate synthase small subunit [bacterium Unc6]|nr:carbamoyl phosphate synthase small subunit [bacterium Unc6]